MGTWCSDNMFCGGSSKGLCIVITKKNQGTWCSYTVLVYSGSLKQLSIVITQQNLGPWCSDNVIVSPGSFKQLSIFINRNI